jgi:hypothetical protein
MSRRVEINKAKQEIREAFIKYYSTDKAFFDYNEELGIYSFVNYLQRAGKGLHTRFVNICNGFPWDKDNTFTEGYEKRTYKRVETLLEKAYKWGLTPTDDPDEHRKGAYLRIQTDPRGWPIHVILDGRVYYLGG